MVFRKRELHAGTAILTRAGDSHGLRQIGEEDLVIIITYPRSPSQR